MKISREIFNHEKYSQANLVHITDTNKINKTTNQCRLQGDKVLEKKSYLLIQSKEHTLTNVNPAYTNNFPVNICSQT